MSCAGRQSPRQGAKAAFDGRYGCQKCFCVTFGESNKALWRLKRRLYHLKEDKPIERSISGMVGKGSLTHNSRAFKAKNVKEDYTRHNIEYCNENIKAVYHELFDEALERYNAKQKRSDRKIDDYYEKIRTSRQEKLFHEVIFQIGNKDDMNARNENGELAKVILDEFMKEFPARNPNLRVFSAHLHMDEETPHLHIDFVPFVTGSKRGLDTRVSLKQALASQGFKGGTRQATEQSQWMEAEKRELAKVMERHGVIWKQLGTHRKHLSVLDFEKQEREREVQELAVQKEELSQTITEIQAAADNEKRDLQELQEQKAVMQKEILKMSSDKKLTEKNIHVIREDPAWQLPEPGMVTTAKSYRDKKAIPLLEKVKETLISALIRNVQLTERIEKLKRQVDQLKRSNHSLEVKADRLEKENADLQEESRDFRYLKAEFGEQRISEIIEKRKALEMPVINSCQQKKKEVSL